MQSFDEQYPGMSELSARISSYELAYRMQACAPEAVDHLIGERRDQAVVRHERSGLRALMASSACWRAGWWSAACASFS